MAVQYLSDAAEENDSNYDLVYACGIAAIKSGDFDNGKSLMFSAIQNGSYSYGVK